LFSGPIAPAVGAVLFPNLGVALVVRLKRPEPEISFHGIARKGIHSVPRFTMHDRQKEWLEENVFHGKRDLCCRPSSAWDLMKARFSGVLRQDTMIPMWLEKDQIAKWLAGKKSEEKTRRKEKDKEAKKSAGSGLPRPATAQTKSAVNKSKGKRIASDSTKDASCKVSQNPAFLPFSCDVAVVVRIFSRPCPVSF
jgi:hypothetical protein